METDKPGIPIPVPHKDSTRALETYFEISKGYAGRITREIVEKLADHKAWGPIVSALSPEEINSQFEQAMELQHRAIYENKWEEYCHELARQGDRKSTTP